MYKKSLPLICIQVFLDGIFKWKKIILIICFGKFTSKEKTIWACFQKFWRENVRNFTIHVCAILQNYLILRQISTFFFNLDASSGIIKMDTIKFEKFHQKDTKVGLWWPCIFTDVLLQKANHHQNQGIGREATRINLKECICLIVLIYENVKPLIICRFVVRYV